MNTSRALVELGRMKMKKKWFKRIKRKCAAFSRWFTGYRKRVRMIESELGSRLEAC